MDRNKTSQYKYVFTNGQHLIHETMSPIEAHKFAYRRQLKILSGPNYVKAKKEKDFDGFGWHSSLMMNFRGPAHYREYLKEHGMVEASVNDCPMESKYTKPLWDEDLIRKANKHGLDIGGVLAEALIDGRLDWPEDGICE